MPSRPESVCGALEVRPPLLLAIFGPTGSGKSALAERLADDLDAHILNADAFQVYRGMDIGTAKTDNPARYSLLDIKNPNEGYGLGEFVADAVPLLHSWFNSNRNVIMVGGTGLYMRALLEQYSDMQGAPDEDLRRAISARPLEQNLNELLSLMPDANSKLDTRNPLRVTRALERLRTDRPPISFELPNFHKQKVGLVPTVETTAATIYHRVHEMVQHGWIVETERLLLEGYAICDPGFRAIGYKSMAKVLSGDLSIEAAMSTTISETQQYAKRQRSWLRSEPGLSVIPSDVVAYDFVRNLLHQFDV